MFRSEYYFVYTSPGNALNLVFTDGKYVELLKGFIIILLSAL